MRLGVNGDDVLDLSIVGYQFPDTDDLRKRYSWHMIQGRAGTAFEAWDFRWQALTCDESPRLARVAARGRRRIGTRPSRARGGPAPDLLHRTQPCLRCRVLQYDAVVITAELDLEFRAPANQGDHHVGHPNVLHIITSPEQLVAAATDWESDLMRYPDGLATGI